MSKLEQNFTIDGKVVEHKGVVGLYKVYCCEGDEDCADDTVILFFVDDTDDVVGSMRVDADMGQGIGYISDVSVVGGKP